MDEELMDCVNHQGGKLETAILTMDAFGLKVPKLSIIKGIGTSGGSWALLLQAPDK
jgi:acetyl-CoA carboxylase alpha subunit